MNVAMANPLRYRGYYYDNETGYYYLQSRYYDPSICRFINADVPEFLGVGESLAKWNLFSYCENEPVNNVDSCGCISEKNLAKVFKQITKVLSQIVTLVKKTFIGMYKMYSTISSTEISQIAKDIGRSPHRVRQSLERITDKLSKTNGVIKRFATGISILTFIVSVGEKIVRIGSFAAIVVECVVETGLAIIELILSEGLKWFLSLVPTVGFILKVFASSIVSYILKKLLTVERIKVIKRNLTAKISIASYRLEDYILAFFKSFSWA